ncbi:MAG: hypothetical protein AAGB34_06140 [Planctomycetota bacterium]
MKTQFAIAGGLAFVLAGSAFGQIATVNGSGNVAGNGNTGFGDVIGNGSMDITTMGDGTVTLSINRASGQFFNNIAIYIDSDNGATGVANTSALTDVADGNRRILSGGADAETANLGFAAGFAADRGIAVEGGFAGMFDLVNDPTNYGFVASVGDTLPSDSSIPSVVLSFNMSDLGLAAGDSFRLLVTYGNAFDGPSFNNYFRADEFIGVDGASVAGGNPGFNDVQLGDNDFILVNSIPTPGAAALLGLAGIAGFRRKR